jgi:hypothetical protein
MFLKSSLTCYVQAHLNNVSVVEIVGMLDDSY